MKSVLGAMFAVVAATAVGYVSPEFAALAPDGSVYVTGATAARVACVSADGRLLRQWPVVASGTRKAADPTGIAASGEFVYVTCGVADGKLQK